VFIVTVNESCFVPIEFVGVESHPLLLNLLEVLLVFGKTTSTNALKFSKIPYIHFHWCCDCSEDMGFDVNRFEGDVDEELICTICSSVLENPLQAPQCEHAFCSACINEWLTRQPTCPVDRASISANELKVKSSIFLSPGFLCDLRTPWCDFVPWLNSFVF